MTQLQITTDKIIDLVKRPGYIYAFIMTIVRDCFYDLNNPEEFESRNKLITEELMTLLGFWVQHSESHWSYPISFDDMYQMVLDADMLMKEMHNSPMKLYSRKRLKSFRVTIPMVNMSYLTRLKHRAFKRQFITMVIRLTTMNMYTSLRKSTNMTANG